MDHEEVGRHWEVNSEAWTRLTRAGYDVARDGLNTPAFLEMLPEADGRSGLDVGCGVGHNTRLVAERGARMVGVDISGTLSATRGRQRPATPLASGTGGRAPRGFPSGTAVSTLLWPL
jgi:SAM-dependent methyltransferase